jgi:hypothetical protein
MNAVGQRNTLIADKSWEIGGGHATINYCNYFHCRATISTAGGISLSRNSNIHSFE